MANPTPATSQLRVGDLIHAIGHDVRTIASDELALAQHDLRASLGHLVARAGIVLFGAMTAMTGLAMLCVVAVVALAPVMPALWLRLLLMSIVYLAIGGAAVAISTRRLAAAGPDFHVETAEAKRTAEAVEQGLE